MNIGIIITTGPEHGGTFFYSLSVLNALRDYEHEHSVVVFYDNEAFPIYNYSTKNWILHRHNVKDSIFVKLARLLSLTGIKAFRSPSRGRHSAMLKYNLDIVICPSTSLAAWWCGLPYIVAVHDVYHRYKYPGNKFFLEPFRDQQWRIASKNAEIVLVESDLGKNQLQDAYKIPDNKIKKQPTGPAPFIWKFQPEMQQIIKEKYKLAEKYIFYPGGFNPGKNQKCIIEAIAHLRHQSNTDIHAILAGPYSPYCDTIKELSLNLKVDDLIHLTGLVDEIDMVYLYKDALALVMASYTGPTNMPIWEAFAAGCPVISSSAGEMPDQVGDAGLLFDPSDYNQLSECIRKVLLDPEFRSEMIARGNKRIEMVKPENWARNLLSIIDDINASLQSNQK